MKHIFIAGIILITVLSGCGTSGKLMVESVNYQALRTDFAQPDEIPSQAKIAVHYYFNTLGAVQPVVFNLTQDTIIIDQTKSFVVMSDGNNIPYVDEQYYTKRKKKSKPNYFNLATIAKALGIEYVANNKTTNDTTLESISMSRYMNTNAVTISDRPMVSIPPKGSIALAKAYETGCFDNGAKEYNYIDIAPDKASVKFKICISYSLNQGETYEELATNFYVSSHINEPVVNRKVSESFLNIYYTKPDALAEPLYLFKLPNNIKKKSSNPYANFLSESNIFDSYIQGFLIDFQ